MIQSNLNIDEEALVQSYFGGGALSRFLKRAIKEGIEQITKKASDTVRTFKLSKGVVKRANIAEPNEFRKSVYDEYGLDDMPLIFDPSKGDAQNYLSRHLSRLKDRGIDYSDVKIIPLSESEYKLKLSDDKQQAIQLGNNMAANRKGKLIVVSDNPNTVVETGPLVSHELDHIFNPVYADLEKSQQYVRKFLTIPEELLQSKNASGKLKMSDIELLARGSQMKDYLGFTKSNQSATPEQYKHAVANYAKTTGKDNLHDWFNNVIDWEGLTDFWNKYSTVNTGLGISTLIPYVYDNEKNNK